MKTFGSMTAAALIMIGGVSVAFAGDTSCNYVQENMFAGPFDVCQEPVNAADCEEIGQTDDNADAVANEGSCSTDALVGTCDTGDYKILYYTGDPDGLEIGCGFQGGDWVPAG